MTVKFDRSFGKSLNDLRNSQVANRIIKLIEQLKSADDLKGISNVKKLISSLLFSWRQPPGFV